MKYYFALAKPEDSLLKWFPCSYEGEELKRAKAEATRRLGRVGGGNEVWIGKEVDGDIVALQKRGNFGSSRWEKL